MNETRRLCLLAPLAGVLALALTGCTPRAAEEPPLKGARIGGPFTLTDQNGRQVTDRNYAGKYRIMYFGFTHCPDVCPTDLAAIGKGLARFEQKDPGRGAKVVPIFITVDPERDTPPVMKEYGAAFHPRLVGLTGTPEQVAAVAKAYAVWYQKEDPQPGGGYGMNHSRSEILMDPEGRPLALLPDDKGADGIAAELERWVK